MAALAAFYILSDATLAIPYHVAPIVATSPLHQCWWFWAGTLFAASLAIGIISVWSGIEAGFLFVPIISYLFPFHFDFVRACSLMVGLAGALAATPGFLKENLTNLRLAISIFLAMSAGSIIGAVLGIRLPEDVLYKGLGVTILGACGLLVVGKTRERSDINKSDPMAPSGTATAVK
ncbi:MAG: sulfite exporter TauE/SafE family protein [Deltaproteobacteria bacterium]|nr:sulfite exporter TauE/SafE family protein [Deltaproteobacteria bacterium]